MNWQNKYNNHESKTHQPVGFITMPIKIFILFSFLLLLLVGINNFKFSDLAENNKMNWQLKKVDTNQDIKEFALAVLKATTEFWSQEFEQIGKQYTPPKIVFTSQHSLQMYNTQTLTSPFYLSKNQTIYLDLSFYHDFEYLLGGNSSNFTQGFIIAHEVAHHAQNLLGTFDFAKKLRQKKPLQYEVNNLSIRIELQADCYAGVWSRAMQTDDSLNLGDIETVLNTLQLIGDDHLQKLQLGYVKSDDFTHGTSKQRYSWFKRGYSHDNIRYCNTFAY